MNGTKNIYLNKKNNSLVKILAGGIILSLALFLLNIYNLKVKNSFYFVSAPVEKTFWTAGAVSSNFLSSFLNARFLKQENENLKDENQKLLSKITSLQAEAGLNLAEENFALVAKDNGYKFLMAGVIGLDSEDMLTINKGSEDGILEGMPVINQQNVLFGKIFKVYKNFSQVMLISDKNSVIDVSIAQEDQTKPKIYGVIRGAGNLAIYLDLVPIDEIINGGDNVVTSSLEKIFPKNLLIGTVLGLRKNDQKPFQQAEIKPFFDLKNADNLFVITNYKQ